MAYRSPRQERQQEWRSSHRGAHDDYYPRSILGDRHHKGPSSSRFRLDRSLSLEISFRDNRGRSVQDRGYDERDGRQYSRKETYSPRRRSLSTEDRRGQIKRSRSSPSRPKAQELRMKSGPQKKKKVRKPVQVDGLGIPVGMMKDQFTKDINSFVKEMNPCVGYEKQKQQAKDRLQDRIYDEYEVHGEADRVDDKYIKKCATKALITWRHILNKALDTGDGKPPELNIKYWEELQRIRESEESKWKLVQMGNQARKRGLKNSTKEKIKQATAVKLSLELGREPYQTELDKAVEKEIAAVLLKNEQRKKKKGNDGEVADHNAVKDKVEDRILLLEDAVDKRDDRMQVWGSMLSKLYEAQFGKSANTVHKQGKEHTPLSEKVQSAVSSESEKSEDEEGFVQSSHDDESNERMTSDEDNDNSLGKAGEVPQAPAKLKEKIVETVEGQADVGSIARVVSKSGSGAGPSERGRPSLSTSEQMPKGVPISKSTMAKQTEPPTTEQNSSPKKGEESLSGRASKKDKSIEQEVATEVVKESVNNNVQVQDRRSTRNNTAASKEKAKEKPSTLETVRQTISLTMLILRNEDALSGKIVIIEDSDNDSYVAIGEIMALDYTPERVGSTGRAGGHQIWVILKSMTKPDTVLSFKIRDDEDRVMCRTLGEAFLKNKGVIWLQSDIVLTETDGCTVSTWS